MADGLIGRLQEVVETRTGKTVIDQDRLQLLEASDVERRAMQKELDLLGYYVLDQIGGQPQEVKAIERRKMAAQARMVWIQDPVAGANVDLSCQFIFGRGVPQPKCADSKVQEVVDEAWSDPDNQACLTTFPAQVALCTDLVLQSNLFILFFEDGNDGKVKLGILNHDLVEDAVRDTSNRLRVLYYVARRRDYEWDYQMDRVSLKATANMQASGRPVVQYYQALAATDPATGKLDTDDPTCPSEKLGDGLVYHIAINRGSEQVFGIPAMRRIVKWMAALNDFMAARVDMTQAAAAFIMRRTVKGSSTQVANIAAKALSRASTLAATSMDDPSAGTIAPGPRPASILNENENVTTEPFSVSTQAPQAAQDAQMIRSQIASATWPQHYLGDQSNANLATASALELPVIKKVESFQELFEGLFRTFTDRVIERAVDSGRLPTELTPEERLALKSKKPGEQVPGGEGLTPPAPAQQEPPLSMTDPMGGTGSEQLTEAYHGQTQDEKQTERDLSYEFSMPSPMKRSMADLITSIANLARTFDPNNTNLELSRTLLSVALGQGLELADPAAAVERILPEGYVDPMVAASMAQAAGPGQSQPGGAPPLIPEGPNPFGGSSYVSGEQPSAGQGPDGEQNPYGAQGFSSSYQDNQGQQPMYQAAVADESEENRMARLMNLWDAEIGDLVDEMLEAATANGNGSSPKH
jgi:hypothetical protein